MHSVLEIGTALLGKKDQLLEVDSLTWKKSTDKTDNVNSSGSKASSEWSKEDVTTLKKLFEMFNFASPKDLLLLFCGTLFTIVNSTSFPVLALMIGNISQTFITQSNHQYNDGNSTGNGSISTTHEKRGDSSNINIDDLTNMMTPNVNISAITSSGSDNPFAMVASVFDYLGKTLGLLSNSGPLTKDELVLYSETYSFYFLIIALVVFISSFIQTYCFEMAAENQAFKIRQTFVSQVLRQEISWFEIFTPGYLISKLVDDVERIREGIGHKFSVIMQYCFCFAIGAFFGLCINWKLTFIFGISVPFIIHNILAQFQIFATKAEERQEHYAKVGSICEEVLPAVQTVAVFGSNTAECNRFQKELESTYARSMKDNNLIGIRTGFLYIIIYSAFGAASIYAMNQIFQHLLPVRQVYVVFSCMCISIIALSNILPLITNIANSNGCFQSIIKVTNSQPEIDPYSEDGRKPFKFTGKITMSHVTFSYKTRQNVSVLRDIDLTVKPGSIVAIVGLSGEGKSTLVDLLLRFYEPQRGHITFDDFDVHNLNLKWLRQNVGIVTSESVFRSDSIYENIRGGLENVDEEDVVRAAKLANAHHFIKKLPEGYRTMIGITDRELSTGEKQLLAIARVLIKRQKVVILDEAYSAINFKTMKKLLKQLISEKSDRTTIILSNSISRIYMVDMIHVVKGGEIVETGNHSELMDKKGVYYQMSVDEDFHLAPIHADFFAKIILAGLDQHNKGADEEEELNTRDMHREDSEELAFSDVDEDFGKPDYSRPDMESDETFRNELENMLKKSPHMITYIFLGIMGCIISGIVTPLFALLLSQLFIAFSESGSQLSTDSAFWTRFIFTTGVLLGVGFWMQTLFISAIGENLGRYLREDTYFRIIGQPIGWFADENHTPEKLFSSLYWSVPAFKVAVGSRLGGVISTLVSLIVTFIISFTLKWQLALVICAALPFQYIVLFLLKAKYIVTQDKIQDIKAEADSIATEAVQNIRTIQTLSLQEEVIRQYVFVASSSSPFAKSQAIYLAMAHAAEGAITFITFAALFYVGSILTDSGELNPLHLFEIFIVLVFSSFTLGQVTSFIPDFVTATSAYSNLISLKNEMKDEMQMIKMAKRNMKPEILGQITFENVTFAYPHRAEFIILFNVSFEVKLGQCIGIVGGYGKSTIISLILGLYDVQFGQVYIEGINLNDINLDHLRSNIGFVAQEMTLFNRSIRENILYGYNGDLDGVQLEELLNQTAQVVCLDSFISNLPDGFETKVGANGSCLTAGEKQRIALARALIRDPKILILDEPTAALDPLFEKLLLSSLKKVIADRTCIVVSKDKDVIRLADHIIVLLDGSVKESGTHEELMELHGEYYEFIQGC